jgi:hypothetical protein
MPGRLGRSCRLRRGNRPGGCVQDHQAGRPDRMGRRPGEPARDGAAAGPGSGCRPGLAPRGTAGMTGPGWPLILACPGTPGCCRASTGGPANWPITAATHPAASPSPPWSELLAAAGPWKKISRPAWAWRPSTSTRSGAGSPGTGGSPWPYLRWPSSPSPSWRSTTGRRQPADPQPDRPPGRRPDHPARRRHPLPAELVRLARAPPAHRPGLPLPAAGRPGPVKARCR